MTTGELVAYLFLLVLWGLLIDQVRQWREDVHHGLSATAALYEEQAQFYERAHAMVAGWRASGDPVRIGCADDHDDLVATLPEPWTPPDEVTDGSE